MSVNKRAFVVNESAAVFLLLIDRANQTSIAFRIEAKKDRPRTWLHGWRDGETGLQVRCICGTVVREDRGNVPDPPPTRE